MKPAGSWKTGLKKILILEAAVSLLFLAACGRSGVKEQEAYRNALKLAWEQTLAPYGVSMEALVLMLRADPEDQRAIMAASVYSPDPPMDVVKSFFPTPESLHDFVVKFVKEKVEVRSVSDNPGKGN